jgi:heptosyltransferase-2
MNIPAKPWTKKQQPKRILVIRLQALGDVVVTLPYLLHLRNTLGSLTRLDFLTRKETEAIPRSIELFDHIYAIGGGRNFKKQLIRIFLLLPKLFVKRYDIIIDLQNNVISNIVRKALLPEAWSAYDRFSPVSGAERYRLTIEAVCLGENKAATNFVLKHPNAGLQILKDNGWLGKKELVVLNPAGAFETRNWNIDNYIAFARLWLNEFPETQFVVMGISLISSKAVLLKQQLGDNLINLVDQTTPSEAFAILQHVKLVLSEDSGLMHMAWISDVPTLAMFGSTRSDWSRPLGEHTYLLDSSDLPCGNCMQASCKFGDVHCLTRYSPEQVFHHALMLIKKTQVTRKITIPG